MKFYFFIVSFLYTCILFSQTTGDLSGRIIDFDSKLPLQGATIIINNSDYGVISDSEGYFIFKNIPPRTYNLSASYLGYETETIFNVIVKSVGTSNLLFNLKSSSEDLEEVILVKSPFKTSKETPLSTQSLSYSFE